MQLGLRHDLVYRRDGTLALKNPSYLMDRTTASLKRHPGRSRGHMNRQNDVLHFKKGALGSDGLFFENIQPRKCDPTLPKFFDEGSFIYRGPSSGLDEDGRRFYSLEISRGYHIICICRRGKVNGDEVGTLK